MFKLNKEIATKNGEVLKPFLVEGDMVHSFNRQGKTVVKPLSDFDFKKKDTIINTMNIVSVKRVKKAPVVIDDPIVELNVPIVEVEEPEEHLIPPIKEVVIEEKVIEKIVEEKKPIKEKIIKSETQIIVPIPNKSYSNVEAGKIITNEEYV